MLKLSDLKKKKVEHETDLLIIGAGPVGLFTVFAAGMLGITNCHLVDSLEFPGGQCSALYPEKFVYDIPGIPKIKANDLTKDLLQQASRFKPQFHLGQIAEKMEQDDEHFYVKTSKNNHFKTRGIIIAGGSGMFQPRKPMLNNLEQFENKSLFYSINSYDRFKNKKVVIAGGGDSAIDFAIILANIADKVYLIHRRDKFRCAPDSLKQIEGLKNQGKIEMVIPYQLHEIEGENGMLTSVNVSNIADKSLKKIDADFLLPFFGLHMNLGSLAEWNLELFDSKQIKIALPTCQTNIDRIYAVGDMAGFEQKIKLILTGFTEATYACHDLYRKLHPDEMMHHKHSTALFCD